jgi:hypothetical protein
MGQNAARDRERQCCANPTMFPGDREAAVHSWKSPIPESVETGWQKTASGDSSLM